MVSVDLVAALHEAYHHFNELHHRIHGLLMGFAPTHDILGFLKGLDGVLRYIHGLVDPQLFQLPFHGRGTLVPYDHVDLRRSLRKIPPTA